MTVIGQQDATRDAEAVGRMLDGFGEGFCAFDPDWRVSACNKAAEQNTKLAREALIGANYWDLVPQALGTPVETMLRRAMAERCWLEIEAPSAIWPGGMVSMRAFPVGDGIGVAFRDVSERQRRQALVRDQAARLELALTASGLGDWSWVANDEQIQLSETAARLFGLTGPTDWPTMRAQVHPDDVDQARAEVSRAMRQSSVYEVRYRCRRGDGAERWLMVRGMPHYGPDGALAGLLGVVADVTEDKRREDLLRESEARFRAMADSAPAPVWVTSADGPVAFVNDAFADFAGQPRAAMLGDNWVRFMHPEDVALALERRTVGRAARPPAPYYFEARFRRADGEWRWMRASCQPRFDAAGGFEGYVGLAIDMTEIRAAETRQHLLINELNHRGENTLATVQSMAEQSARLAASKEDFKEKFLGRLMALSAAHRRLTQSSWTATDLGTLVEDQIVLHGGETNGLAASGPQVAVPAGAALSLSMALHELATNALKYGALSVPEGSVNIAWVIEDGVLRLDWTETGGPPVAAPGAAGFGTRLLNMVGRDLGGAVDYLFEPDGVRWNVSFQLPH